MRVSSPSSSSPRRSARLPGLVVTIGTLAVLLVVAIALTGGFVFNAGPFRVSAHHVTAPLLVAVLAWSAAAFLLKGQPTFPGAALWPWLERHAVAIAIVIAAASAGVGIRYGTYAASGADAGGYLSQSELLARGEITFAAPLAAQVGWPEPDWVFSPLGYRPSSRHAVIAPMYPPGLPLVMAVSQRAIGEWGSFLVVPLLGFVAVVSVYLLAVRLHSRSAGLVAAVLLATSPIFLFYVSQPMSDVPAAAWWAVALLAATAGTFVSAGLAGLAAGLAILTRPNLLPFLVPLFACVAVRFDAVPETWPSRMRRLSGLVIGLAPAGLALLLWDYRLYGNPFESGYGSASAYFAMANVFPNIRDYWHRMIVGEAPALFTAAASVLALSSRRDRPWPGVRGAVLVGAGVFAVVILCYLPFGVFRDWFYLRYFLPAFPAVFVAIGALATASLHRVPANVRGVALSLALAVVALLNVHRAAQQGAFTVRDSEARYQLAGRYLDAALPPNAVIFAFQESASARYYTHFPVIRWDLLDPSVDLDAAIARTRAMGRHPVLLVEEWEAHLLTTRFPNSAAARLDWRPRAQVLTAMPVRVFDPADRGRPTPAPFDALP